MPNVSTTAHGHVISSEALYPVIMANKEHKGAQFTVKSRVTGKDYTFKISRSQFNERWYTHIKVEVRYQEWKRLGTFIDGTVRLKGSAVDSPSALAIGYILRQVSARNFAELDAKVEMMHVGKCVMCGKALTDAESIRIGLGPVCRG